MASLHNGTLAGASFHITTCVWRLQRARRVRQHDVLGAHASFADDDARCLDVQREEEVCVESVALPLEWVSMEQGFIEMDCSKGESCRWNIY